jgi:hypothetical protein
MVRLGYVGMTIREDLYNKMKEYYKTYGKDKSFATWLATVVTDHFEARKNSPLEVLLVDTAAVYLKNKVDNNRLIQVVFKDNGLYCNDCKRDDCLHVGFALANKYVNERLQIPMLEAKV